MTISTCEACIVNLLLVHGPLSPGQLGGLAGFTSSGTITGVIDRLKHIDVLVFAEVVLRRGGHLIVEQVGRDSVELLPGLGVTVPRGLQHRPIAPERTIVLMSERAGVHSQETEPDRIVAECRSPTSAQDGPLGWTQRVGEPLACVWQQGVG